MYYKIIMIVKAVTMACPPTRVIEVEGSCYRELERSLKVVGNWRVAKFMRFKKFNGYFSFQFLYIYN